MWEVRIDPGARMPPHEHLYDFTIHTLGASTLAVLSAETGDVSFTFVPSIGETSSFHRREETMVDPLGVSPAFPRSHGFENVGNSTYHAILVEAKPDSVDLWDDNDIRRVILHTSGGLGSIASDQRSPILEASWDAVWGETANHETEILFAEGFTGATLLTLDITVDISAMEMLSPFNKVQGHDLAEPSRFLVADYTPIVSKELQDIALTDETKLRHVLLLKFKPSAPVGRLAAGYASLHEEIPEMLAFEWGPVNMEFGEEELAQGFEYVFVTTFAGTAERDLYLRHAAHDSFARLLFPHIDKVVVVDFVEADQYRSEKA